MARFYEPPQDIQGICVAVNGDLVRHETVVISVRDLIVFPRGIVIHSMAWTRAPGVLGRAAGFDGAADWISKFPAAELTWQVQIGDGVARETDSEPRNAGTPWLLRRQMGAFAGNDRAWQWTFWLSPVSPKEGLRISVDWPEHGIVDAGLVVQATTLASAARLASRLW